MVGSSEPSEPPFLRRGRVFSGVLAAVIAVAWVGVGVLLFYFTGEFERFYGRDRGDLPSWTLFFLSRSETTWLVVAAVAAAATVAKESLLSSVVGRLVLNGVFLLLAVVLAVAWLVSMVAPLYSIGDSM